MSHSDLCHLLLPLYPVEWGGSGGGTCDTKIGYKTRETNRAKILSILAEVLLIGQYSQMTQVRIAHLDSTIPCWQCCGSGLFIPDPRAQFLSIPDSGSYRKKFYPKNCLKNMGWGSGIWKKSISDPRIRIQGSKRHQIRDLRPGYATPLAAGWTDSSL
jgi:hypothetical protein